MAPINRTIREQVTDQIRDDVVAGKFPAGQALRESELAERFGVSRGPVRDAFLQLSQEGFLAYQANRGVTVRNPPDSVDHEFIVSLRQQIECHVIKRGLERIEQTAWEKMETALAELESAWPVGRDCESCQRRHEVPRRNSGRVWRNRISPSLEKALLSDAARILTPGKLLRDSSPNI